MDTGYIGLITASVALSLIFLQRTEKTKRRIVASLVIICFVAIRHLAFLKNDLHEETLLGFIFGTIVSWLFWLLLGKYNPVGSSDNIKVIGMDD